MAKTIIINGKQYEVLNATTKKAQDIISRYEDSDMYCLDQAYKYNYSVFKARAERDILNEMEENNGFNYKIVGAGSCFFSCAYTMDIKTKVLHWGGEMAIDRTIRCLIYHTPTNRYIIK